MDEFVWAMEQKCPGMFNASAALPTFVDLDNGPELWNTTHEEVLAIVQSPRNLWDTSFANSNR